MSHEQPGRVPVDEIFKVRRSWSAPDLAPLLPSGGRVERCEERRRVDYVDTGSGTLQRLGVTLRHDLGDGGGWQLELPGRALRTVPADPDGAPPAELTGLLADVLAGQPLGEVARVDTMRSVHRALDDQGRVLVELTDDLAQGSPLPDGHPVQWRELAVRATGSGGLEPSREPAKGADKVRRKTEKLLVTAGARRTEPRAALDRLRPIEWARPARSSVAQELTVFVQRQCTEISLALLDLADAAGPEPETSTGPAARASTAIAQLLGALRVFATSFEPARPMSRVEADLAWIAEVVAAVPRGAHLGVRSATRLEKQPAELVLGPVPQQLAEELAAQRRAVTQAWSQARRSSRYRDALAGLAEWLVDVPATAAVKVKPGKTVAAAEDVLSRRLGKVSDAASVAALRRCAYDLVSAREVLALEVAEKPGRRVERVLELLDEHDLLVAEGELSRSAAAATGERSDRNGFTFGLWWAQTEAEAEQVRSRLRRLA